MPPPFLLNFRGVLSKLQTELARAMDGPGACAQAPKLALPLGLPVAVARPLPESPRRRPMPWPGAPRSGPRGPESELRWPGPGPREPPASGRRAFHWQLEAQVRCGGGHWQRPGSVSPGAGVFAPPGTQWQPQWCAHSVGPRSVGLGACGEMPGPPRLVRRPARRLGGPGPAHHDASRRASVAGTAR